MLSKDVFQAALVKRQPGLELGIKGRPAAAAAAAHFGL
jgi:hypothetical protein